MKPTAKIFLLCSIVLSCWLGLLGPDRGIYWALASAFFCCGLVWVAVQRGKSGHLSFSFWEIFVVALVMRLPFWGASVWLSDDIWRYLLDGRVQGLGFSPYALSPVAFSKALPIVSELVDKVNHSHLKTLYPPLAQLFFRLTAPLGVIGIKGALLVCDLLTVLLLCRLLKREGEPVFWAALYAWNPMVVWEVSWSGHVDVLAFPFLMLALVFYAKQPLVAGFFCGLSFWVKLVSVLFFPFFVCEIWKNRKSIHPVLVFAVGAGLATFFCFLPYGLSFLGAQESLHIYGTTWEFSGFFFRLLRNLTGMNLTVRAALALFGGLGIMILIFRQLWGQLRFFDAMGWAVFLWLLLTPTLHPWYGLYLAVWLPLMAGSTDPHKRLKGKFLKCPEKKGAIRPVSPYILTVTPLLGYEVLSGVSIHGRWEPSPWTPFCIVLPPVIAWMVLDFKSFFVK
ncbi:MAG: hypothetical protein MI742_18130 [Desulfobacterales bacterium]|nr:hypothetical protein [Desulfobacterales bacterium]